MQLLSFNKFQKPSNRARLTIILGEMQQKCLFLIKFSLSPTVLIAALSILAEAEEVKASEQPQNVPLERVNSLKMVSSLFISLCH